MQHYLWGSCVAQTEDVPQQSFVWFIILWHHGLESHFMLTSHFKYSQTIIYTIKIKPQMQVRHQVLIQNSRFTTERHSFVLKSLVRTDKFSLLSPCANSFLGNDCIWPIMKATKRRSLGIHSYFPSQFKFPRQLMQSLSLD